MLLPEPLWPTRPTTSPRRDFERKSAEHRSFARIAHGHLRGEQAGAESGVVGVIMVNSCYRLARVRAFTRQALGIPERLRRKDAGIRALRPHWRLPTAHSD